MESEPTRVCSSCKGKPKPLNWKIFKLEPTGEYAKTCKECQLKKGKKKATTLETEGGGDEDFQLPVLPLSELSYLLEELNSMEEIEACVNIDPIVASASPEFNLKQEDFNIENHLGMWPDAYKRQADAIAQLVRDSTGYRFVSQSSPPLKKECGKHFHYHCVQLEDRQHKSKKATDPEVKRREKGKMAAFQCEGWMHIYLTIENPNVAGIKLAHVQEHVPYFRIEVPEAVKASILDRKDWSFSKIWSLILVQYPTPPFSRKAYATIWQKVNSKAYKRDEDELESAKKLLKEMAKNAPDSRYQVKEIDLPNLEGFKAISFVLPHFLETFRDIIREISLDSTWNTNGLNYECFAILGEVHGSGCPLGYLLILASGGVENGKEQYIQRLLEAIKSIWGVIPKITLTDKDWSEINACKTVFPEADHQLCYWHVLKAIKQRLAIAKRRPRFYDVEEAMGLFPDFINDPLFVPIGQVAPEDLDRVNKWVPENTLARLTITLGGVVKSTAPIPAGPPVTSPDPPIPSTPTAAPGKRRQMIIRYAGKVVLAAEIEGQNQLDELDEEDIDGDGNNVAPVLTDLQEVEETADVMEEDGMMQQLLTRRFAKGIEEDITNEKKGMYDEASQSLWNDPLRGI